MRNTLPIVLLFLLVSAVASAADATSVLLRWSGTTGAGALGSDSIRVSNLTADTLTLDLIIDADAAGVSSYFLSLRFDTDLADELNTLGFQELTWSNPEGTKMLFQLNQGIQGSQESTGSQEGFLFTFEGVTLGDGPENTSFVFGQVVFSTNPANVANDGTDVRSGIFNVNEPPFNDIDGIFDNAGNDLGETTFFGSASVNPVPEPGTFLLVGAACVLLTALRGSSIRR